MEKEIILNPVTLLLIGFKQIGENGDFYTSFRKDVLSIFEFAWYSEDKFLRLQTKQSGFTIQLKHIITLAEFLSFYKLLTGQDYAN